MGTAASPWKITPDFLLAAVNRWRKLNLKVEMWKSEMFSNIILDAATLHLSFFKKMWESADLSKVWRKQQQHWKCPRQAGTLE